MGKTYMEEMFKNAASEEDDFANLMGSLKHTNRDDWESAVTKHNPNWKYVYPVSPDGGAPYVLQEGNRSSGLIAMHHKNGKISIALSFHPEGFDPNEHVRSVFDVSGSGRRNEGFTLDNAASANFHPKGFHGEDAYSVTDKGQVRHGRGERQAVAPKAKPQPKSEPKAEPKPEPKQEPKTQPKPAESQMQQAFSQPQPKAAPQPQPAPQAAPQPQAQQPTPQVQPQSASQPQAQPQPQQQATPKAQPQPQAAPAAAPVPPVAAAEGVEQAAAKEAPQAEKGLLTAIKKLKLSPGLAKAAPWVGGGVAGLAAGAGLMAMSNKKKQQKTAVYKEEIYKLAGLMSAPKAVAAKVPSFSKPKIAKAVNRARRASFVKSIH